MGTCAGEKRKIFPLLPSSLTRPTTPKPAWARSAARRGWDTCAVSVQMKFLFEAGEVESKTTSRTRTDLEGKPEEDNSMFLKAENGSRHVSRRSASPVRRGRLGLSNLSSAR